MAYLKLFKELWYYAGKDRWKIVLYFFAHFLSVSAGLLTPFVFGKILNSIQLANGKPVLSRVAIWIAVWAGLCLWANLFHRIGRYFEFDLAYRVKQRFLNRHYYIITNLPLKWHTDHHSGDTINRINLAATALHDFADSQYIHIENLMMFWGPLIALSFLSWKMAMASFFFSVFTILIISQFDKRLVALYRDLNEINHKISAILFDYVSNIKTLITLRLGERTAQEYDHKIELGYRPYMMAETWVNAFKWFMVSFCSMALQAGIIFYYIWLQISKNAVILIGNVAAAFQYLQQLSRNFENVARDYQQVIHRHANYEAANSIEKAFEGRQFSEHSKTDEWKKVIISNLNFEYQPGKSTLRDITFSFRQGEKIALVGESGCGKSTLMAILRGLYDPQTVQLNIDGKEFPTLGSLFETTTLIPQEPEIFENTIRYNITFDLDYPEAEILEAVRIARFDKVMERLPRGLETDVREKGVTLSGGERQRLALARGILAARDSSIILMDEPTSSVDSHNEMDIYENIFDRYKDQTIISSVHRLHLLNRFDRVIVMSGGRIVQTGSFDELKAQPGIFKNLWMKYQASSN